MRKRDERGDLLRKIKEREQRGNDEGRRDRNKEDIWKGRRGKIGKMGRKGRGMKSNRKQKKIWKLKPRETEKEIIQIEGTPGRRRKEEEERVRKRRGMAGVKERVHNEEGMEGGRDEWCNLNGERRKESRRGERMRDDRK